MRMSVNESIKTVSICNNFFTRPWRRCWIYAKMSNNYNIVSFFCSFVYSFLNSFIQFLSVFASGNLIDEFSLSFIHEISRCRFCVGFRCHYTNKSNLCLAEFKNFISICYRLVLFYSKEVTCKIREVCFFHDFKYTSCTIIKFMVSKSCNIIACSIHQFDDTCAIVHCTVSCTLSMITGINKSN